MSGVEELARLVDGLRRDRRRGPYAGHGAAWVLLRGERLSRSRATSTPRARACSTTFSRATSTGAALRIATALLRRVPWRPWRYAAAAALTAPAPLEGTLRPHPGIPNSPVLCLTWRSERRRRPSCKPS